MGGIIVNKLYVLVTLILCGAAIIFGNLHWNNKISAHAEKETSTENVGSVQEETNKKNKELDLSKYSSHLPEALQEKINKAASSKQPLKFVIYGTSDVEIAWSAQLIKELKATYGDNVFEITVLSTGDKSTRDLVNDKSYEEINELKPDILLFEPSMLKDNGLIGIINTLENVQTIVEAWQGANKEMTLMIQPPNPLHSATYYPSEIAQLKEFSEKNGILYLNHWENWPDLEDEKMKDYLTNTNEPNESGNRVWADYLINYFIAK
jgi:hypothetical protein